MRIIDEQDRMGVVLACNEPCLASEEGGSCGLILQNQQATCTHGTWICGPIDAGTTQDAEVGGPRTDMDAGAYSACFTDAGTLACGAACLRSEEGGSCGLPRQDEQATCRNGVWVCGPLDGGTNHDAANDSGLQLPTVPDGQVQSCYGNVCPMGVCGGVTAIEPTSCSTLYTAPVDGNSTYCNPNATGAYCLILGPDNYHQTIWLVRRTNGVAGFEFCPSCGGLIGQDPTCG